MLLIPMYVKKYYYNTECIYSTGYFNIYKINTRKRCNKSNISPVVYNYASLFKSRIRTPTFVLKIAKPLIYDQHDKDYPTQNEKRNGYYMWSKYPKLFVRVYKSRYPVIAMPYYPYRLATTYINGINAIAQICNIVHKCHLCNIVHGDIKPDNYFVVKHGKIILGDWDVSQCITKDDYALSHDFKNTTMEYSSTMNPLFLPKFDKIPRTTLFTNDYYCLGHTILSILLNTGYIRDVDRVQYFHQFNETNLNPKPLEFVFDISRTSTMSYSTMEKIIALYEKIPIHSHSECYFVKILWYCKCFIIQAFIEKRDYRIYQLMFATLFHYYMNANNKINAKKYIEPYLVYGAIKLKNLRHILSPYRCKQKTFFIVYKHNSLDACIQQDLHNASCKYLYKAIRHRDIETWCKRNVGKEKTFTCVI